MKQARYASLFPHFITVAFRQIFRNKVLSLVNTIGLAVGICTFFIISYYVSFEMSYDSFHKNKEQIFRVGYRQTENGEVKPGSAKNFIGVQELARQLPEVTATTAFNGSARNAYFQFVYEGKNYYQPGSFYQTDDNFFKVFPSLLLKGDPTSALSDPHNLVLSQKMATLIFGDDDPIGKKIENRSYSYSQVGSFVVTGVMVDAPENAHFHVNFIAKTSDDQDRVAENFWTEPWFYVYLTLTPGTDREQFADKLNLSLKGLNAQQPKTSNIKLDLQPITEIHNIPGFAEELEPGGNKLLLYVLAGIGIAVLICAWINYINIETGRHVSRAKEIGVRKTLGSAKGNLLIQFFTEHMVNTTIAIVLAGVMCILIIPFVRESLQLPKFDYWSSRTWVGSCIFFALAALATGFAIASIFSTGKVQLAPARVARSPFRTMLMAFQFTCSASLIAILLLVNSQATLMMSTNKKIDIENVVSIRNPTVYSSDDSVSFVEYNTFQNELTSNTMVNRTTASSAIPGMEVEVVSINRLKRNALDPYDATPYKVLFIDYDYLGFYNLKLKGGRNFSIVNGDSKTWNTIMLNETAARALGFSSPSEAIDQEVQFHLFGETFRKFRIIGIVEDYHHESARSQVQPTIFSLNHGEYDGVEISFQQVFFSVKLNRGTNAREGVTLIEQAWKKLFPDKPFEYFFQDEYYDRQFKTERKFASVFGLFTGVSMLIACLGVIGMTLFETKSRAKEISVRKVLGATVANLVAMLSAGHLRLIIVSSIASAPIIYFFSSYWLSNYAIRVPVTIWLFAAPVGLLTTLVAVSSGIQTIKAALANPVDNLNDE